MPSGLEGRHFITTQEWTVDELETVLALAGELKAARRAGRETALLPGKTLYMIFFDSSTRTRNSFETGMTQLGGHAIFLSPDKMQISHGENAKDTAKVLSRYGEGIAIRHCAFREGNGYLREVARWAEVPVLNMQCDVYHPCQILADYLTIRERFGTTRRLKLGVAWTSAPNYIRPLSVPQSLILMMPRFGIDVTLAYPPEFALMPEIEEQARRNAAEGGVSFEITNRFEDAFEGADVVIPKSWGPLMHATDRKEGLALIEKYPTWRCDAQRMALGKPHIAYMHPLPADRGREVTDEVIDGPASLVYEEAENRLHVQKALMALTMVARRGGRVGGELQFRASAAPLAERGSATSACTAAGQCADPRVLRRTRRTPRLADARSAPRALAALRDARGLPAAAPRRRHAATAGAAAAA
jgi:N-acetylornithine carbamoyltransferase